MADDVVNIKIIHGYDEKEGIRWVGAVREDMCGRCEHKTTETYKVLIAAYQNAFDFSDNLKKLIDFIEGN